MKKTILTFAFTGIATSLFAYHSYNSPGDEIGAGIIGWTIVISAILNIILFFKILNMTKDVKELKNRFCKDEAENVVQLNRTIVKLNNSGRVDEAKKILDEYLRNEVFAALLVFNKSTFETKQDVDNVKRNFEKYYTSLNCEMPVEIREIDVENVKEEYSSLYKQAFGSRH